MSDSRASILIVDDDAGLLRLLSMRLSAAGYDVATAGSGEEALASLPRVRPRLVISDLRMEGMDGMTLFDIIHERDPTLPVIILTAHGTIPDAVAATHRGVFGYLTKPFDSRELLERVDSALEINPAGPAAGAGEAPEHDWRAGIVSRSGVMSELMQSARRVASSEASVLIQSESGTGKELLARAIHRASPRHAAPFVAVNASAIPEQLLESELFGHVKGSFTGATGNRKGLFQAADGGTLFLDEIGDMPLSLQAKLLRVLQDKEVRPVGASKAEPVDVRILSATHQNLERATEEGRFREDLYYRLNVVLLELPPLRERREDIPLLANHFLRELRGADTGPARSFAPEAMELLVAAPWPGNVRQLRNIVEHVCVLATGPIIPPSLVQKALRRKPDDLLPFAEARERFERDYLVRLLQITEGNVSQAARLAGRNRTEFYKLLGRHHLEPDLFRDEGPAPPG
ncbi:MAG: sigma 54-interacting transcriptional regulator [Chromatiales bacterium]|jgi:two-component system response regulator GlrR